MWIVVCVPLMALGVVIAVAPVLGGSIHHHRLDRAHGGPVVADGVGTVPPGAAPRERSVKCPVCSASMEASSDTGLIDAVRRHAWRVHGIPSEPHILESAHVA